MRESSGQQRGDTLQRSGPWLTPLRMLVLLLTCTAIGQAIQAASPHVGVDYYQFWAVGRAVARGEVKNVYAEREGQLLAQRLADQAARSGDALQRNVAARRRSLVTTGTPLLYTILGRLSTPNYTTSLQLYRVGVVSCFCGSVLGLSWLFRLSPTSALLALSLLLIGSDSVASDLRVGNVNCLQLGGLTLYALLRLRAKLRNRDILAGVWMGLLLAFKPNLVVVAMFMVARPLSLRQWRAALRESAAIAAGAGLAVLLTCWLWQDSAAWLHWFGASTRELSGWATVDQGNVAPLALLPDRSLASAALTLGLAGLVIVGFGLLLRDPNTAAADVAPWEVHGGCWWLAVGSLASLLFTHLAWVHYFVLTVPGLLLVASKCKETLTTFRSVCRAGLIVSAWILLANNSLRTLDLIGSNFECAVLTLSGVAALLCCLFADFRRDSKPRETDSASPRPRKVPDEC